MCHGSFLERAAVSVPDLLRYVSPSTTLCSFEEFYSPGDGVTCREAFLVLFNLFWDVSGGGWPYNGCEEREVYVC